MGKQSNTAPRVLALGLPQANSSLFEPTALVCLLSRQHKKSDSYGRCAWFVWKSGAYGMHGEAKNNYEHNVVVMNLPYVSKNCRQCFLK